MTAPTTLTTTTAARRRWMAMAASAALPFAGLLTFAPPAGADPAGNNGTIKVDGEAFDNGHPDNEPHVDCRFEIDFYGFDQGDLWAQVTFNAHEPTGHGEALLTDKVWIGEDGHGGGGSPAGLDAHKVYDLSAKLAKLTPHDQQGYHVKLTVNAEGSQGADTKHKVFWVDGCRPTTPDVPKDTPDDPKTPDGNGNPAGQPGNNPAGKPADKPETKTEVKTETASKTETKTGSRTEVLGVNVARPNTELPHTGVETLPLAGLGLLLLGSGQAARLVVRRRVG